MLSQLSVRLNYFPWISFFMLKPHVFHQTDYRGTSTVSSQKLLISSSDDHCYIYWFWDFSKYLLALMSSSFFIIIFVNLVLLDNKNQMTTFVNLVFNVYYYVLYQFWSFDLDLCKLQIYILTLVTWFLFCQYIFALKQSSLEFIFQPYDLWMCYVGLNLN